MKNTFFNYLAVTTLASFTLAGCATSNDTASTASMTEMNRTETSARGGFATDENGLSVLMVEKEVMMPIATISVAALPMENSMKIGDMFKDMDTKQHTVYSLAQSNPNLSTFAQLLERANLVDDIERLDKITLFAPTNEAFAQMPREKLEMLLKAENTAALSHMLQNHVLPADVTTASLNSNSRIRVSDESYIVVDRSMNGMTTHIGGAQILKGDVKASNGRLHVIDKVILPSEDLQSGPMK